MRATASIKTIICLWAIWALSAALGASESYPLQAPLSTIISAPLSLDQPFHGLAVDIDVPPDAPADLGVGAWVSDRDGQWFQVLHPQRLKAGSQHLTFHFTDQSAVQAIGHGATWDPSVRAGLYRCGIFFWSEQPSSASLVVTRWELLSSPPASNAASSAAIHSVTMDKVDDGQWQGHTGQRSVLTFLPQPMPANPYDPEAFQADVTFTHGSGNEQQVPAFWRQVMTLTDRGDRETQQAAQAGHFEVRFRPRLAGRYTVVLTSRRQDGSLATHNLPDLVVGGPPWDDYVRVDPSDPRFFTVNGEFFWPIGLNLHSISDKRGVERIGHQPTPHRGSQSIIAYLQRLAASGANTCEIWMSNWNLGLEWRPDWPGYEGLGRYAQGNGERLDRVLDTAWALGLRVNLVINNHGQVSERTNREWGDNPYNQAIGGIIEKAADYFRNPQALAYQRRYRRYLAGRYADHPAILGWKLSSEINLTAGKQADLVDWHEQASQHWRDIDQYGHPVTSHWSGTYTTPNRRIVALPGLDYVCINAYQKSNRKHGQHSLANLLWRSTQDPRRGLAQYAKPVLVTEYGGSHMAASRQQLLADHRIGAWVAMTAGHAGSPMMWWFEWIDQHDLWAPYRAIAQFMNGEDLRSEQARGTTLTGSDQWWVSAWVKPGRILGYALQRDWDGDQSALEDQTLAITVGQAVNPGLMHLEWWSADQGQIVEAQSIQHRGGPLTISTQTTAVHLAFKLYRLEQSDTDSP